MADLASPTEDYDTVKQIRAQQFNVDHGTSSTPTDGDSKFDEADMQVQASMTAGEMAFSRDKSKAKLSDFEFRKLIGKGTFGKVFMV